MTGDDRDQLGDSIESKQHTRITFLSREGYPFSPEHYVTAITDREGLMALPGQGQRIDLREDTLQESRKLPPAKPRSWRGPV